MSLPTLTNFYASYTTQEITTDWQQLEKGMVMGFSISAILFTAVFEAILIGGRQMVHGVRAEDVVQSHKEREKGVGGL